MFTMNTQTQEALKMAIEAMKWLRMRSPIIYEELEAEKACKEALAQSAQEPVAWMSKKRGDVSKAKMYFNEGEEILPLYTHPAPSWQGLSDDEKLAIIRKWKDAHTMREQELIGLGDAIEQALKEKNT